MPLECAFRVFRAYHGGCSALVKKTPLGLHLASARLALFQPLSALLMLNVAIADCSCTGNATLIADAQLAARHD
eukprot:5059055-Amphidinium_carterae.1